MLSSECANTFAPSNPPQQAETQLGSDRLLDIRDVAEITGLCGPVASRIMTETGRQIILHKRKYILQSSLMAYLRSREGGAR